MRHPRQVGKRAWNGRVTLGPRMTRNQSRKTSIWTCKVSPRCGTTLVSHQVEGGPPMLMRTDPFRELDRLTQQVLGTAMRPTAMPMDAYRKDDSFLVQFDLPGIDPESIDLTVERNVLTVHASRTRPSGEEVEMLAAERPHGSFSRQLFLGDTLDVDALQADYTDGVLTLRIPVAERAKPRKVSINAQRKSTEVSAGERQAVDA